MEKYRKIAYFGVSAIIIALGVYLFFRYAIGILLPFIAALGFVGLLRPLINKMCRGKADSRSAVSILLIIASMLAVIVVLYFILSATLRQLGSIAEGIIENLTGENNLIDRLFSYIENIGERLPFLSVFSKNGEDVSSLATEMLLEGVRELSVRLSGWAARAIANMPRIFITFIVLLLSLFYIAKDYDKIGALLSKYIGKERTLGLKKFKESITDILVKYLKSYALIMLLTFAQIFFGLMILGIKNAFVLSIIISVIDLLPILGAGTVLIPWAIVLFITNDIKTATGLVILAAVIYVVRQLIEPRIVSKSMNVHPMLTVFSMYVGFRLGGVGGMIISPLIAFIVISLINDYKKADGKAKIMLTSANNYDRID